MPPTFLQKNRQKDKEGGEILASSKAVDNDGRRKNEILGVDCE
jgi:hypothetical protein